MSAVVKKRMGVLAVMIGAGIAGWVLHNQFVERQPEYTGHGFKPFGIALPMIGVGIYRLRGGGQAKDAPTQG